MMVSDQTKAYITKMYKVQNYKESKTVKYDLQIVQMCLYRLLWGKFLQLILCLDKYPALCYDINRNGQAKKNLYKVETYMCFSSKFGQNSCDHTI